MPGRIPFLRSGLLSLLVLPALAAPYPDRFVWVFGWNLGRDSDVEAVRRVLEQGARHGLNGAVVSFGLDTLCRKTPDYLRRLDEVKAAAERHGIELIPAVFSAGYGGGALAHDRNLAEGLPVERAPFTVRNDEARFEPDSSVQLVNGGFEDFTGPRLAGFGFHDQPGEISFVDTEVRHGGRAALRLENFTANPAGNGRVMQEVRVTPRRCYRVSVWVKTEGVHPAGAFRLQALAGNRSLAPRSFPVPATGDWQKLTTVFNSLHFDRVRLYAGVWAGRAGRLWLDDWTLEEVGPLNVLHRPGTPVTVQSEDGATTYVEGRDYARLEDPGYSPYRVDRPAPALRLPSGSRLRDGQRLRVSWYHPMVINDSQVTVCLGEPALDEFFEHEVKLLAERLRPRRVMLNMDEIRMGGTCGACRGRNMAELLGACITRQAQAIRRHLPDAQIYIWSDMLDPHHNARPDYYLVEGDYTGSWRHVPKDIIPTIWGRAPREKSLQFFATEGFTTLIGCYYDAEDLQDVSRWLEATRQRTNVRGFMYTPWQRKYDLLPQFGDLLQVGR